MVVSTNPVQIRSKAGVKRDGTRFDGEFYVDAQWVRFQRGLPRKMGGFRTLQNAVSAIPRAMNSFSRTGYTYLHVGHGSGLDRFTIDASMNASPPLSRTPAAFTTGTNVTWTFDEVYDPIINNEAMLVAHAAPNLVSTDVSTELPVFWGKVTDTAALQPMALPIVNTATTIAALTGSITTGSAVVTGLASTASLSKNVAVSGTGIPAGTRILSVDSGTQVTLTANSTATNASAALTFQVGGVSGGVLVLHPYVLAYGSNGIVLNSTASNPNDFFGTGSNLAYITDQKIVAGRIARGGPGYSPSGLLWSLNALIRVYFSGGLTTFSYDTLSDDTTIMSPQSVIEVDGVFFWAGTDRFFMFNGSVRELDNQMSMNWFFDNVNRAAASKVFSFRNTRWGEVWWCFPFGTATECTHAVIYNYRENCWYDTQLPGSGRSCAIAPQVVRYPLMGGVDINTATGGYRILQHEIGTDEVDGSRIYPITAWFETADITMMTGQQPANSAVEVLQVEPDFVQSGDMQLIVKGNANARSPTIESAPINFPATATGPQDQVCRFREVRRQMRFKFVSSVIGGHFEMGQTFAQLQKADSRTTQ